MNSSIVFITLINLRCGFSTDTKSRASINHHNSTPGTLHDSSLHYVCHSDCYWWHNKAVTSKIRRHGFRKQHTQDRARSVRLSGRDPYVFPGSIRYRDDDGEERHLVFCLPNPSPIEFPLIQIMSKSINVDQGTHFFHHSARKPGLSLDIDSPFNIIRR